MICEKEYKNGFACILPAYHKGLHMAGPDFLGDVAFYKDESPIILVSDYPNMPNKKLEVIKRFRYEDLNDHCGCEDCIAGVYKIKNGKDMP